MIRIAAADKDELFHKMAKKAPELPPVKQGGITDQTICLFTRIYGDNMLILSVIFLTVKIK